MNYFDYIFRWERKNVFVSSLFGIKLLFWIRAYWFAIKESVQPVYKNLLQNHLYDTTVESLVFFIIQKVSE